MAKLSVNGGTGSDIFSVHLAVSMVGLSDYTLPRLKNCILWRGGIIRICILINNTDLRPRVYSNLICFFAILRCCVASIYVSIRGIQLCHAAMPSQRFGSADNRSICSVYRSPRCRLFRKFMSQR